MFSKLTVCLQLRQQIVGSYSGHNQELVAKSFGELVEGQLMISPCSAYLRIDIESNLAPGNRDQFTNKISQLRLTIDKVFLASRFSMMADKPCRSTVVLTRQSFKFQRSQ